MVRRGPISKMRVLRHCSNPVACLLWFMGEFCVPYVVRMHLFVSFMPWLLARPADGLRGLMTVMLIVVTFSSRTFCGWSFRAEAELEPLCHVMGRAIFAMVRSLCLPRGMVVSLGVVVLVLVKVGLFLSSLCTFGLFLVCVLDLSMLVWMRLMSRWGLDWLW